jgi:ribonuclease D
MQKHTSRFFNPTHQQWEDIEVLIDTKLNYDYSHCTWFAIDGEFTGLFTQRDNSVIWTIASEDTSGKMRVEMLYTYTGEADLTKLKELLQSDKEKLLWFGKLDIAYLYKLTGVKIAQPIYDVKLASVLSRTYTQDHHLNLLFKIYINDKEEIFKKNEFMYRDWVTEPSTWPSDIHQYNVNDVVYLKHFAQERDEVINSANIALPELGVIYAHGFYRDVFMPGYDDRGPRG